MGLPSGELPLFDHAPVGNCMGGPTPSNSACDPRFVNATAQDFRLQAGSPAIDAGDPLSPVPVGGGSRVDAGRYEYGAATPPYDYQSRLTLADSTPRFTWETVDIDPRLGDPDGQSKFQIQIDPRPTFDSLSEGRPALDSGIVTSTLESYTIPNARALAPGEYYVRVRQWDRYDFEGGAWSDRAYRVRVSGEPQPPYIASQNPAPGAQGVNENTSISAHVKDDGVGVNVATLRMYVNGALVTPVVGGSLNDYTLTYTPPSPFTTGTTVTVRITADDFNLSPPGLDVAYGFTIRDTTPPLPPANVRVIP